MSLWVACNEPLGRLQELEHAKMAIAASEAKRSPVKRSPTRASSAADKLRMDQMRQQLEQANSRVGLLTDVLSVLIVD